MTVTVPLLSTPVADAAIPSTFAARAAANFLEVNPMFAAANLQNIENNSINDNLNAQGPVVLAAAAAALGAVNFQGLWSTLTGALSKPASTYHNDTFWILATDTTDVTLDVPGVSDKWVRSATSAADIFLNAAASGLNSPTVEHALLENYAPTNVLLNPRLSSSVDTLSAWSSVAHNTYLACFWKALRSGSAVYDAALVSADTVSYGSSLQLTTTTAGTPGSFEYSALMYTVDSSTSRSLVGRTFTIRGVIKSDIAGLVPVVLTSSDAGRSYAFGVTVAAGVETPFSHTLVGGLDPTAVWGDGNLGAGLKLSISLACGTGFHAPSAEVWATGNYLGLAGQLNAHGTVSRKISIAAMSVSLGTAKPAETTLMEDKRLAAAQFQYGLYTYWAGASNLSQYLSFTRSFSTMRATPAVTVLSAVVNGSGTTPVVTGVGDDYVILSSTGTANTSYFNCLFVCSLDARL